MTEALDAVLNYGFQEMEIHSVEATVNPNNAASIRVLQKQVFTREAYSKEDYYFKGRFLDSAVYSLICRNFNSGNRAK